MRKEYQKILKAVFRGWLLHMRDALNLTQVQMAEKLYMDERSYVDLEHGKSCGGALTLVVFLLCCPEPTKFFEELRHAFEAATEKAA